MWPLIKLMSLPIFAAELLAQLPIGQIASFIGIAAVAGGALVVGYYKAVLSTAKDEIQLMNGKLDRIAKENLDLTAENKKFREAPNLEKHAELMSKLLDKLAAHDDHTERSSAATQLVLQGMLDELRVIHKTVGRPR